MVQEGDIDQVLDTDQDGQAEMGSGGRIAAPAALMPAPSAHPNVLLSVTKWLLVSEMRVIARPNDYSPLLDMPQSVYLEFILRNADSTRRNAYTRWRSA